MANYDTILLRGTQCVVTDCGVCGVVYTVPKVVYDHHYQEGGYHHCPNGHPWRWSKETCERERLRRERTGRTAMDGMPTNHRLAERKLIKLISDGEWQVNPWEATNIDAVKAKEAG